MVFVFYFTQKLEEKITNNQDKRRRQRDGEQPGAHEWDRKGGRNQETRIKTQFRRIKGLLPYHAVSLK